MPIRHTYPSGWGADGSTSPADDADADTVSPTQYKANHDGYWLRRLTANAVSAVTTMADINATDFNVPILASKSYMIRAVLFYRTNATTTGARFALNGPASPTLVIFGGAVTITPAAAGSAITAEGTGTTYDGAVTTHGTGPAAVTAIAFLEGAVFNGLTAGNLRLRFASEVAIANGLTVLAGSYFEVREFDN
jgi:hypothetical protein